MKAESWKRQHGFSYHYFLECCEIKQMFVQNIFHCHRKYVHVSVGKVSCCLLETYFVRLTYQTLAQKFQRRVCFFSNVPIKLSTWYRMCGLIKRTHYSNTFAYLILERKRKAFEPLHLNFIPFEIFQIA